MTTAISGSICGYPYATEEQAKQFVHAEDCPSAGLPFIRIVLGCGSASIYACHACKQVWTVPDPYFGDECDNPLKRKAPPDDWWGWRYVEALEVAQSKDLAPVWVQERGAAIAHLLHPGGWFKCGRATMDTPLTVDPLVLRLRQCKRC